MIVAIDSPPTCARRASRSASLTLAGGGEVEERAFVPDPQARGGQTGDRRGIADPLSVFPGRDEAAGDLGVLEHPSELVLRGRVVEGHGDRPGEPHGVVTESPVEGSGAEDRDLVLEPDSRGDEPLGGRTHLRDEVRGRHLDPLPVGELREGAVVGVGLQAGEEDIGRRGRRVHVEPDDRSG